MSVYIGITGLPGSGKDTLARLFLELAQEKGFTSCELKLSDEVRRELVRRGLESNNASRSTLIKLGNELRSIDGGGALARKVIVTINNLQSSFTDKKTDLYIISGIRNPDEVLTFRERWGKDFVLFGVVASRKIRIGRLIERNQYIDDTYFTKEIEEADEKIGIQICQKIADYKISNETSIRELKKQAKKHFKDIIESAIRNSTIVNQAIPAKKQE